MKQKTSSRPNAMLVRYLENRRLTSRSPMFPRSSPSLVMYKGLLYITSRLPPSMSVWLGMFRRANQLASPTCHYTLAVWLIQFWYRLLRRKWQTTSNEIVASANVRETVYINKEHYYLRLINYNNIIIKKYIKINCCKKRTQPPVVGGGGVLCVHIYFYSFILFKEVI